MRLGLRLLMLTGGGERVAERRVGLVEVVIFLFYLSITAVVDGEISAGDLLRRPS